MAKVKAKAEINSFAQANFVVAAVVRNALFGAEISKQISDQERKIMSRGFENYFDVKAATPDEVADQLREDIYDCIIQLAEGR